MKDVATTVMERCDLLGNISEESNALTRPFGSQAMREVNKIVAGWMRDAGMTVRQDAIKNLIGRYEGVEESEYTRRALARQTAINKWLYDEETGFYQDLNWTSDQVASGGMAVNGIPKFTGYLTLAGVYPLFVGLAEERQAAAVGAVVAERFLAPGGVRTSLKTTGQQWDNPNGWAPLHWIAIKGLRDYGHDELAREIARRWLEAGRRVYRQTGKIVEKYNVVDTTLQAGGGEYENQDGFGWSNGVFARILEDYTGL